MPFLTKKGGAAAALFLSLAVLPGCKQGSPSAKPAADAAPAFTLKDLSGRDVSLADYRGKVVMVDFWATWCPPCRVSIPALEALYKEYASKGLQIVSVSLDEDPAAPAEFAKEQGMTYPVLLGAASDAAEKYRVRGIPALFLVDKEGNISRRWIGFDDTLPKEWRESIDKLL